MKTRVEQVKAAEQAGFAISWFAEHDFSNCCVCPSPLVMIARLVGETSRIKLGSGVVVVPLYHPVQLMSEIGMVAALTHGRLVLGVGSGHQPYEFERFGAAMALSVSAAMTPPTDESARVAVHVAQSDADLDGLRKLARIERFPGIP